MIYLDNAASTRPAPEVVAAMADTARDLFANPSSAHALGAAAARALEEARDQVARALGAAAPAEIAQALPHGPHRPHLHVDAVQAFGFLPIRVGSLGADSLAISGHKLHGPKGTGALWLRPGARITPLWDGGRQERGLRSGT